MRKSISAAVAACCMLPMTAMAQMMDVPEAVRAPAGSKPAMTAIGVGELTYECKAKAADAMAFEWAFVGPIAKLMDTQTQKEVGKYYAGPTWESMDGSKVTGKQVAVAPGAAGNIPLQLVKADPAMGTGAMTGVTYIQRVNTKGGVAPADPCSAATAGMKKTVPYQADYVFYKM
ncbi:MAG: DUF3455 domain-containing protein [Betaproteobacteria bacterium]